MDAQNINNKRLEKIIKDTFEEQYSPDLESFQEFQQSPVNEKIIYIDNIHYVNRKHIFKLFEFMKEHFDYIVMTSQNTWSFNMKEKFEDEYRFIEYTTRLEIKKFYSDKRLELIKKIISLSPYDVNDESLDKYVANINSSIKQNLRYFDLSPYFIIIFTNYICQNMQKNTKANKLFGVVFETNLKKAIEKATNGTNTEAFISVIQRLAYHIHFNKEYPFSRTTVVEIVEAYNMEYGQEVNTRCFIDNLVQAKLFQDFNGSHLRFVSASYLAFFVAKEIIRRHTNENDVDSIASILNDLCFGINADIALFVTYLTTNNNILEYIFADATKFMEEWEAFDFSFSGYPTFRKLLTTVDNSPPTEKDKSLHKKNEALIEQLANNSLIETNEMYDYGNEDPFSVANVILKGLKYAEIVSRILPGFDHEISVKDKEKYIEATYEYPSKILHKIFYYLNQDGLALIDELAVILMDERNITRDEAYERAKQFITDFSTGVVPGVYKKIADSCIDSNTIKYYKDRKSESKSEKMFTILAYESGHEKELFIKNICKLYEDTADYFTKIILCKVARHFLLTNNLGPSDLQRLLSMFPKRTQIRLRVEKYKSSVK